MNTGDDAVFQPLEADDPATVGSYRLTARLGAGGMGKVYLSYTPAGRAVAVKVIRPEFAEDPEFRRRFRQEVQAAQRVHGLYTAPVIDSDADGTRPWLATAFVQGPTLSSAVAGHGALPLPTLLLLVAGIAEALQAVHAAGLVHRDLKPSNVLLAADGPRVIDFGIARAADSTALTDSGVTIGTPAFMSPEQAAGREITPATDVFALGQVAAYAALGAPAYGEGPSHAVLYRIVHEEPDLSRLPEEVRPLVARCLAKEPEERPSLAEIVAMCQAASDGTQLRRPEQWLPGALAAEIPVRHALPGYTPTQAAGPPPPVPRPDGPPPAQSAHPSHPYQPTQAAPPVAVPGPVPPPPQPVRPAYGPGPRQAPRPYQQPYQQQHMQPRPFQPLQPPKKSKAPLIGGLVAAAIVLLVVVPAVVKGLGSAGGSAKDDAGAASSSASAGGASSGTSSGSPSGGGGTSRPPAAPPAEPHPGVQLPDGYHLDFADSDLQPKDDPGDDFSFQCTTYVDPGCRFGADSTKLVLLDRGEKGSLDTCLKDSRFTQQIDQPRLSAGSQICARTSTGVVALLTYKGASAASSPSTYATFDVTLWRNAVPAED
jgi:serine/threonine protein kinase